MEQYRAAHVQGLKLIELHDCRGRLIYQQCMRAKHSCEAARQGHIILRVQRCKARPHHCTAVRLQGKATSFCECKAARQGHIILRVQSCKARPRPCKRARLQPSFTTALLCYNTARPSVGAGSSFNKELSEGAFKGSSFNTARPGVEAGSSFNSELQEGALTGSSFDTARPGQGAQY
eukprot:scaffold82544_cov24-Tisochrysis_lutea.AAC.1